MQETPADRKNKEQLDRCDRKAEFHAYICWFAAV